jgi:hypothetical protein
LDVLIKPASRLQGLLRLLLIIPEFGLGYFFFELVNFDTLAVGIKDTLESAVSFPRSR